MHGICTVRLRPVRSTRCNRKAPAADAAATEAPAADATAASDLKVGFIFLHDENSTYDLNFMNGAKEACANLGLSDDQVIFRTNIPEGQECYDAAAELADAGCNVIFADSFGHEDFMIQAAKEFPEVQFCHATGTKAHTEDLANYHNAFASIYEGRYLAGVAAGLKLNEMIANGEFTEDEAKIGYVGAFTYAEVVSGYTSFFLGARSVCPTATMEVTFTGSWYDETAERKLQTSSSATAASSSASTLTPWALPPHARPPASPTFPTTAPPRLPAPTLSSFLPASTGLPTMSTLSPLL